MQIVFSAAGIHLIDLPQFGDARGFFCETYRSDVLNAFLGEEFFFVQGNHSRSSRGVLRGLHYQLERPQGKLVRVVSGEILDVVVDLRRSSKTFGSHWSFTLSDSRQQLLWVPPGFAHGFCTLSDSADLCYSVTDYYAPESERRLLWNDPQLAISWPIEAPLLSARDASAERFEDLELFA